MIKKTVLLVLATVAATLQLGAQGGKTYVNREWTDTTGHPVFNPILNVFGIEWSKSITAANGDLIMVGHSYAGTNGEDIYVTRRYPDGIIVFEQHYDIASAHYNDYGSDVYESFTGDILVCGTTDNGGTTDYDVAVLRISATGTYINDATRQGQCHLVKGLNCSFIIC